MGRTLSVAAIPPPTCIPTYILHIYIYIHKYSHIRTQSATTFYVTWRASLIITYPYKHTYTHQPLALPNLHNDAPLLRDDAVGGEGWGDGWKSAQRSTAFPMCPTWGSLRMPSARHWIGKVKSKIFISISELQCGHHRINWASPFRVFGGGHRSH